MAANHLLAIQARDLLCRELQMEAPSPPEMIGSMVSIPLPTASAKSAAVNMVVAEKLQSCLFTQHGIEVPIFHWKSSEAWLLRVSLQSYNSIDQVKRLAEILRGHGF